MTSFKSDVLFFNTNELAEDLKQLFIGSSCHLESAKDFEELKHILINLDKLDNGFKSFDLVTNIYSKLDKMITIDENKFDLSSDILHDSATKLAQDIIKTDKYKEFIEDSVKKTQQAAISLVGNNSNIEFKSLISMLTDPLYSKNTEFLYDGNSLADDTMSYSSSVMFLRMEKQNKIASNLCVDSSIEKRKLALDSCLRMNSVVDILSEVWKSVKESLQNILLSFDDQIWITAIKIVAKNLCLSGNSVQEMYSLLIEVLVIEISGTKSQFRTCSLDIQNPYIRKLLIAFRLISKFLQDISQKHLERKLIEMIEMTIELFCWHPTSNTNGQSSTNQLSPMDFISLVDHQAAWFSKLMHGVRTRILLCKVLKNKHYFVKYLIYYSLNAIKSLNSNDVKKVENKYIYAANSLKLIKLQHYLSIILKLISYKCGREFFPVVLPNKKQVYVCDIILASMEIVFIKTQNIHSDEVNSNDAILNMLIHLSLSNDSCEACFLNEPVIHYLQVQINNWVETKTEDVIINEKAAKSLQMLEAILSTPKASIFFLNAKRNYAKDIISCSISSLTKTNNNELFASMLINICGKLLVHSSSIILFQELKYLQVLIKGKKKKVPTATLR